MLTVRPIHCSEENDRVTALAPAHVFVPKDFHEVARLRLRKIGEVVTEPELMEQARRAGTVCIPAAPNSFAVALVADDQLIQGGEIELQLSVIAQGLDCSNK